MMWFGHVTRHNTLSKTMHPAGHSRRKQKERQTKKELDRKHPAVDSPRRKQKERQTKKEVDRKHPAVDSPRRKQRERQTKKEVDREHPAVDSPGDTSPALLRPDADGRLCFVCLFHCLTSS